MIIIVLFMIQPKYQPIDDLSNKIRFAHTVLFIYYKNAILNHASV